MLLLLLLVEFINLFLPPNSFIEYNYFFQMLQLSTLYVKINYSFSKISPS